MQIKTFFAAFAVLGLLASCAQMERYHPMDMSQAVRSAKTSADHEALAKHYEDEAKRTQVKLQEHKKMFEQYEAERLYYGRQGLDMETHCRGLIHLYEQAVEINMNMAASHRKMAADAK